MITEALLYTFFTFISFVISLFPVFSGLPQGITTAFSSIGSYLNMANGFFPMDTLWSAIVILVTFEMGILTFKTLNFVINKVRGSG